MTADRPTTLQALRESGWQSKSVKHELRDNYLQALQSGGPLFPGIVGYDDTVIPEVSIAVLAGHDMLFLGEKGQAKSRLMRSLVRFLDEYVPYLDLPGTPIHEDPLNPITKAAREHLRGTPADQVRIAWWHRDERYAERLAPGRSSPT
jgi:magnesium chelatase subunit I